MRIFKPAKKEKETDNCLANHTSKIVVHPKTEILEEARIILEKCDGAKIKVKKW